MFKEQLQLGIIKDVFKHKQTFLEGDGKGKADNLVKSIATGNEIQKFWSNVSNPSF